jgi:DNA-binding NarL/FixJ family response regulator
VSEHVAPTTSDVHATTHLRVVVADDHPVYRNGLVTVLRDRSIEVITTADSGEAAVEAVARHGPDVVLLDLAMPGIGGLEAARQITGRHPGTAVLVLTMSDDDASLFAALRAGAHGYLLKEASGSVIADAVHAVARGEAVLGNGVSERVLAAVGGTGRPLRRFPQLTDRELEVLELVARGWNNERIASHLYLSNKTVRNYVSTVLTKIGAATRAEAIAAARDAGVAASGNALG